MRTPSPSTAIALAALTVALTGSATAGVLITGKQVKDNSIGVHDLTPYVRARLNRPRAIAGAVGPIGAGGQNGQPGATGTPGAQGTSGTNGAAGTNGSTGASGAAGATGAAGSARAYARVAANGTFTASKGIVSVTVAANSGGSVYCVIVDGSIALADTAPVVTVAPPYPQSASAYIAWVRPGTTFCPSDARLVEVETKTANNQGEWTNAGVPFRVVVP